MQLLKILKRAWESIILNFIIKLLLFKNSITNISYNSILVITDRLIKYVYFINYIEVLNAEDLIYTFLRMMFANHDILTKIISDWDKLFIFKFWKLLINQLRIKHKLFTAYYL